MLTNLGNFYYQWLCDITRSAGIDDIDQNIDQMKKIGNRLLITYDFAIEVNVAKISPFAFKYLGQVSKRILNKFEESTKYYELYLQYENIDETRRTEINSEIEENKILIKFSKLKDNEIFDKKPKTEEVKQILAAWKSDMAKLSKISPYFPQYYLIEAELHQILEEFEESYKILDDLHTNYSTVINVSKEILAVALRLGHIQDAVRYVPFALNKFPKNQQVLCKTYIVRFIN